MCWGQFAVPVAVGYALQSPLSDGASRLPTGHADATVGTHVTAMDLMELAADSARVLLALTFALAAVEKFNTIRTRSASFHPVLLARPRLRAHAMAVMVASLLADVATIVGLTLLPAAGVLLAISLLGLYTLTGARALWTSASRTDCRCLFGLLETRTLEAFLLRNALLVLAGTLAMQGTARLLTGATVLVGLHMLVRRVDLRMISTSQRRQGRPDFEMEAEAGRT
jgi:uncharacterized membrane protein YphA (DoxX/SURF4 family)